MEISLNLAELILSPAVAQIPSFSVLPILPSSEEPSTVTNGHRNHTIPEQQGTWHFFCADLMRSCLMAAPKVALGKPPRHIDVYFGPDVDLDSSLCRSLQADASVLSFSRSKLANLPFIRHIMSGLHHWSSSQGDHFETEYLELSFGSHIVLHNMVEDPRQLVFSFATEGGDQLRKFRISAHELQSKWGLSADRLPQTIDIDCLHLVDQPSEAITLVTVDHPQFPSDRLFVFKSPVRDVQHMYHELFLLLAMDPHPNIISAPLLLVTEAGSSSTGRDPTVCGFILEYFSDGSLRDALRSWTLFQPADIDMGTRVRWALQLGSALVHVTASPATYYCDLKLDNILLTRNGDGIFDLKLIDFEHRGAEVSWTPPEWHKLFMIGFLATPKRTRNWLELPHDRYRRLIQAFMPGCEPEPIFTYLPQSSLSMRPYMPQPYGHHYAWSSLSRPGEREKAMVFMFGKVLWCIFELQPTINSALFMNAEIFQETNPQLRFPEFRQTPKPIQELILKCVAGASELTATNPHRRAVCAIGRKLFPVREDGRCADLTATAEASFQALRNFWLAEVESAERYIGQRTAGIADDDISRAAAGRPTIREVMAALDDFAGGIS